MIKAGLPTSRKRNLFLGNGEDSGILFQWNNTSLPTLTSSDRALGWEGTSIKKWAGSSWASISGGTASDVSLDDAYDDGTNILVDGAAVQLTGTHATNNVLEMRLTGSGTGNMIDIENSSTGTPGYDIIGTGDSWSVDHDGAMVMVGITGCDALTAAANLTLEATGAGTITIGGTSSGAIDIGTGGGTLTIATDCVITGSADADVLTITDGDVLMSNGLLQIVSDDTTTGSITITSAATSGNVISALADDITSGSVVYVDSNNEASFSGDGGYLNLTNNGTSVFKVQRYGATVIAGNAGSDVLTITAGDVVLSDASITITDADNAASLSVTNDTATTNDVIVFTGAGTFTGDSFMLVAPTGLTSGSAVAITCAALTSGEALLIAVDAITTGNAVKITQAGETIAAGELLTIDSTESGDAAAKTGALVSITSDIEQTTNSKTQNYDVLSIVRVDEINQATKTLTSQGSVLKLLHTGTKTSGTALTDTVITLEVEQGGESTGTGALAQFTNVGVGSVTINVVGAGVGADDVLITGSGAHTNGLSALHVTTSGALATGGAIAILTAGGSPTADSRGLEMDVQKDMRAVYIDTDAATHDAVYVTHSGNLASAKAVMHVTDAGDPAGDDRYVIHAAITGTNTHESVIIFADGGGKDVTGILVDCDPTLSATNLAGHLTLYSDAASHLPIIMNFYHDDSGAASGEYCARMLFYGHDDSDAKELYGSIEVEMDDASNANPDGIIWIKGDLAGTNTNSAGFTGNTVMLGEAASTLTTAGTWDLTISTNMTTALEPKIVLTDGAAGSITITAGGTSGEIVFASPTVSTSEEDVDDADPSATTHISIIKTGGARARTLANHTIEGFVKELIMDTDAGDYVLTITTGHTIATLTFDAVGDCATLKWIDGAWALMSHYGCTVA